MHRLSLFPRFLISVTSAVVASQSVEVYKYDGPLNKVDYSDKVRDGVCNKPNGGRPSIATMSLGGGNSPPLSYPVDVFLPGNER